MQKPQWPEPMEAEPQLMHAEPREVATLPAGHTWVRWLRPGTGTPVRESLCGLLASVDDRQQRTGVLVGGARCQTCERLERARMPRYLWHSTEARRGSMPVLPAIARAAPATGRVRGRRALTRERVARVNGMALPAPASEAEGQGVCESTCPSLPAPSSETPGEDRSGVRIAWCVDEEPPGRAGELLVRVELIWSVTMIEHGDFSGLAWHYGTVRIWTGADGWTWLHCLEADALEDALVERAVEQWRAPASASAPAASERERVTLAAALEMLTALDPGGSRYIAEMQNTGRRRTADEEAHARLMKRLARRRACARCRGRGKLAADEREAEAEREAAREAGDDDRVIAPAVCSRCRGSGVARENGLGSSTRSTTATAAEVLTSQEIAALLAAVPRHKADAALVFVNADPAAQERLEEHLVDEVLLPELDRLALDPLVAVDRAGYLAALAVAELRMVEGKRVTGRDAARYLMIAPKTWRNAWAPRHRMLVGRLRRWVEETGAALAGARDARRDS